MSMSAGVMAARISGYKENTDPASRFRLPVFNEDGTLIGTLMCVDEGLAHDPSVIEDLTQWRTRNMRYFLSQFDATAERTLQWLDKVILPSDDRLLFLICTEASDIVGNFGLCNMRAEHAELDNLIRGRNGGGARLIFFSELAILAWLFGKLEIPIATLHVFSNNARTIRLHSSVGFAVRRSFSLTRRDQQGEVRFEVDGSDGEPADFCYQEMFLSRETFFHTYPWVSHVYPGVQQLSVVSATGKS